MTALDELIGYAKANSESAALKDDRMTWAAHHRNCLKVKEERESDAKVIAALREALRNAAEALDAAARTVGNGPYSLSAGQRQFQDNLRAAVGAALLAADEQTVGECK